MTIKPILWLITGPNGAGKSTLINNLSSLLKIPAFVNPDVIAAALDPINKDEPKVIAKAGRIAIELRKKYISQKQSFGIESTFTGNSIISFIQNAIKNGYVINIVFVGLQNVDYSISRVSLRIKMGGHNVPRDAILRRYPKSLENLIKTAHYANKLYVFDNSGIKHNLLLNMEKVPNWSKNLIPKIIEQRINVFKENEKVLIGGKTQELQEAQSQEAIEDRLVNMMLKDLMPQINEITSNCEQTLKNLNQANIKENANNPSLVNEEIQNQDLITQEADLSEAKDMQTQEKERESDIELEPPKTKTASQLWQEDKLAQIETQMADAKNPDKSSEIER